ncbi:MAG: hypothetical protein KA981_01700 [Bacteroidia bacterium]|nr:hypothetical protein [Bacteroidia bacterium]
MYLHLAKTIKEKSQFLIGEKLLFRDSYFTIHQIDIVPVDIDVYNAFIECSFIEDDEACLDRFSAHQMMVRYATHETPIGLFMNQNEMIHANPQFAWVLNED